MVAERAADLIKAFWKEMDDNIAENSDSNEFIKNKEDL